MGALVVALAGGVGFTVLTAISKPLGAAADTAVFSPVGDPVSAGSLVGTLDGQYATRRFGVQTLSSSTSGRVTGYCLNLNVRESITGYQAKPWSDSQVPNLDKITWIVQNGYPNIGAQALGTAAGISGMNDREALLATQAAIWHFSNAFELNTAAPLEIDLVNIGLKKENISVVYSYLISSAKSVTVNYGLVSNQASLTSAGLFGPFTAVVPGGSPAQINAGTVTIVVDGKEVGTTASIASGQQFFLKPGTAAANITLSMSASMKVGVGTLLLSSTGGQPIMVNAQSQVTTSLSSAVTVTVPAVNPKPPSDHDQWQNPPADQGNASLKLDIVGTLNDSNSNNNGKAEVGESIDYKFTVTNTSKVVINNIVVKDTILTGSGVAIVCPKTTLKADESMLCDAKNYTVVAKDIVNDKITNVGSATGVSAAGTPVKSNEVIVVTPAGTLPAQPTTQKAVLVLTQKPVLHDTNGDQVGNLGETVTYTFTVKNDGTVPVTTMTIADQMLGNIAITCAATELAVGKSTTCESGAYTITAADVSTGQVRNVATAYGDSTVGKVTSNETIGITPTKAGVTGEAPSPMTLSKKGALQDSNGDDLAQAGESIIWSFVITNAGTSKITNVRINDPMLAKAGVDVGCPATEIEPGSAITCTSGPYRVTDADARSGRVKNVATASGDNGSSVTTNESTAETQTDTRVVDNTVKRLPNTGSPVSPLAGAIAAMLLTASAFAFRASKAAKVPARRK